MTEQAISSQIVGIFSGKGGVGKTTIALNLARRISARAKVVLVDLDLANRGASGILSAHQELKRPDLYSYLCDPACDDFSLTPIAVSDNLYFLPSSVQGARSKLKPLSADVNYDPLLRRVVDKIWDKVPGALIIIDCHGGLEQSVRSSYRLCSYAIIVTEPDIATFTGTLALAEELREVERAKLSRTHVSYIVNRVSTKFSYRDLRALYEQLSATELALAPPEQSTPLIFMPSEEYLFETFGEYPFQVDLAPDSVFRKKLLILEEDLSTKLELKAQDAKLGQELTRRKRRRIERIVKSVDERDRATVIASYILGLVYLLVVMPTLMIVWGKSPVGALAEDISTGLAMLLGIPVVGYAFYGAARLFLFLKRRLRLHIRAMKRTKSGVRHGARVVRIGFSMILMVLVFSSPIIWWLSTIATETIYFGRQGVELAGLSREEAAYVRTGIGVDNSFQRQANLGALSARARLREEGFTLKGDLAKGRIRQGTSDTITFPVSEGDRYWVVGGCDLDCVEMRLEPLTNLLVLDSRHGDSPETLVIGRSTGEAKMRVLLDDCLAYPCYYSVAIYGTDDRLHGEESFEPPESAAWERLGAGGS